MSEAKVLRVFEHERLSVGARGFTRRHWELLARWAERQKESYFDVWNEALRFKQWVGVIEVEDLVIEVLPKAEYDRSAENIVILVPKWKRILLQLLEAAGYLDIRSISDASLHLQNKTLLDVLFTKYLDLVEVLINKGLVKRYRAVSRNRAAVKGRIDHTADIRENMTHAERVHTVAFEYDHLHVLNHILKAAVDTSVFYAPSAYTRSRAKNLALFFSNWPYKNIVPEDFSKVRFDRKTKGYEQAIQLAKLILGRQNPDISRGSEKVFSLLFDMNHLWEKAVLSRLRRELSGLKGMSVTGQQSKHFWCSDSGVYKTVRPDIIIHRRNEKNIVVDTKWKVVFDQLPGDQDLKQIFTYDALWDAPKGFLVYPRVTGLHQANRAGTYTIMVNGTKNRCSLIFAEVDPEKWKDEPLLNDIGI